MNLLIAAATPAEIAPLIRHLTPDRVSGIPESYRKGNLEVRCCFTGVGAAPAAYALTRAIYRWRPELIIQAGIAGCFDPAVAPGAVFRIERDYFADLGAEGPGGFLDLFALGLDKPDEAPFRDGALTAPALSLPLLEDLPPADAVTVNTVTGSEARRRELTERYHPALESMEGAAFHYVCLQENIPFLQLRSVSNQVEIRDKSRWNIPVAVDRLNAVLTGLVDHFQNHAS